MPPTQVIEILLAASDCSVGFVLDEHGSTPLHTAIGKGRGSRYTYLLTPPPLYHSKLA